MASNELPPRLIDGGWHVDDRGTVAFVNDFDFRGVDRFYMIRWRRRHDPRGWVGHHRQQKWFFVVQGTALIAIVKPDHWESPARNLPIQRFVLSAARPQVLHVPPGHATASINRSEDVILMIFSSGKIEDAKTDDYRFAVDTWPVTEP